MADLRVEVAKDSSKEPSEEWWGGWFVGYSSQGLSDLDQALCSFADKLTRAPASMLEADLQVLRGFGLDDVALHDAVQVVAYFNYINRVADALHVDLEDWMPPYKST